MPQVVLENVTFSYVHVFEARRRKKTDPKKFSCCVLIDKNNASTMEALKQAQKDAINEGIAQGKWTAAMVGTLKLPIRDGDGELKMELKKGDEWVGRVFVNANSLEKYPPGIAKPEGGEAVTIKDPLEIYSGCKGHAYLSFYPFKGSESKGIAVGLNGLYKLEDGERLDGRIPASSVFADYAREDDAGNEGTDPVTPEPFSEKHSPFE